MNIWNLDEYIGINRNFMITMNKSVTPDSKENKPTYNIEM